MVKRVFIASDGCRFKDEDAARRHEQCYSALMAFEELQMLLFDAPVWERYGVEDQKEALTYHLASHILSAPVRNKVLSLVKAVAQNTPDDDWQWDELIDLF